MNKSKYFFLILFILTAALGAESFYLKKTVSPSAEEISKRQSFTKLTGLPDLCVYSEEAYTMHRSLAGIGNIFPYDPFSPETSLSSAVYKKTELK